MTRLLEHREVTVADWSDVEKAAKEAVKKAKAAARAQERAHGLPKGTRQKRRLEQMIGKRKRKEAARLEFARVLVWARKAMEWSQSDLARILDVSPSFICRVEQGDMHVGLNAGQMMVLMMKVKGKMTGREIDELVRLWAKSVEQFVLLVDPEGLTSPKAMDVGARLMQVWLPLSHDAERLDKLDRWLLQMINNEEVRGG